MLKRFIVKKYIMAKNAKDAIKKDKSTSVDDVWVCEDWKKMNDDIVRNQMVGFGSNKKTK